MPKIGDWGESLESLHLDILTKSHVSVPFCLNFPDLDRRQVEGWKSFEVKD